MPTNKYVPDELDQRHNALEKQISEAMLAASFCAIRAYELIEPLDEYVVEEYAAIGRELGTAYERLVKLADQI